jgi:hypothetical protein
MIEAARRLSSKPGPFNGTGNKSGEDSPPSLSNDCSVSYLSTFLTLPHTFAFAQTAIPFTHADILDILFTWAIPRDTQKGDPHSLPGYVPNIKGKEPLSATKVVYLMIICDR